MTRNTIGNMMSSLGLLAVLYGFGAFFHYDSNVIGVSVFVIGAALMLFAPSTKNLTKV